MSRATLSAGWGIVVRDWLVFRSYPTRTFSRAATALFGLALFYYVSHLVSVPQFPRSRDYFAFVVVGLSVLEIVTSTLSLAPAALRSELLTGTFERLAVSTLGPEASIVAMLGFPTLFALASAVIMLGLGVAVFGLVLHWATVPLAVPAGLLAALAFWPLALFVAAAVLAVKQAATAAGLLVSVLSLFSGAMFPTALLPAWSRWVSDVQPLTPATKLLRHELVGGHLAHPGFEVLRLVGFTVVLFPLSLVALRASVRFCRRRGTLLEY